MSLVKIIYRFFSWIRKSFQNYRYGKILAEYGDKSNIISPLALTCPENIHIGKKVRIAYKCWLAAVPHTHEQKCQLIIKDGCMVGNFNHIYATKSIILEEKVLTADRVYISDNQHGYKEVNIPIVNQAIVQKKEVIIGEGSWIGENVCIIGACIGKHCVIGANAVVTKDIPDYSVVVGNPARIIKQYNFDNKEWERI